MQTLNQQTGKDQSFLDDQNIKISSSNDVHSILWEGFLPVSRGGTGTDTFTDGSIPFIAGGIFSEDNTNLHWDLSNNRLGIGTNSPATKLHVNGPATIDTLRIGRGGGSENSNTSIGFEALKDNTTGYRSVALGYTALLSNTTGGDNTAVGHNTLKYSTVGSHNTALGSGSLQVLTAGSGSTGVGALALANSTSASQNTAVGQSALGITTTGSYNAALGAGASSRNTTGSFNVSAGLDALGNNSNGNYNIALGFRSGVYQADFSALTTTNSSIYIGSQAKALSNNNSNSIVIGSDAVGAGSNTAVIGNDSVSDVYLGSSDAKADVHAEKLYLGSSSTPGCIIMGDSDGNGVTYITVNDGAISASSTQPAECQ